MKRINYLILLFLALIITMSCSNDDDTNSDTTSDGEISNDSVSFPSIINDYWKYDVPTINNDTNNTIVTQDSLYVTTQSASTFLLGVNNGLPANGPIIGLLSSGELTSSETTLSLDGTLEFPAEINDLIDFDIALTNFVLYDTEANSNTELASNSNTITQDFNGFPLTINYELTSTALGFDESLSLNGTLYSNVVSSKMVLNLSVSTVVEVIPGIPFTLNILDSQDILVSTNYYADAIGLVQANSNTSYQISATAITALEGFGITLPIPASGSTTINQIIVEYNVAE